MGTRWLAVMLFCLGGAFGAQTIGTEARRSSDPMSPGKLMNRQGNRFTSRDVIFVQQYYDYAPMWNIDQLMALEHQMPQGSVQRLVRGQALPNEVRSLLRDLPKDLNGNLTPAPRGITRYILGRRVIQVDSKFLLLDMIYLPTDPSPKRKK